MVHKVSSTHADERKKTEMPLWPCLALILLAMIAGRMAWVSRKPPQTSHARRFPLDEFWGPGWLLRQGKLSLFDDQCPPTITVDARAIIGGAFRQLLAECIQCRLTIEVQAVEINAELAYSLYAQGQLTQRDFFNTRSGGSGQIIDIEPFLFEEKSLRLSIYQAPIHDQGFRFVVVDERGTSHHIACFNEYLDSLKAESAV